MSERPRQPEDHEPDRLPGRDEPRIGSDDAPVDTASPHGGQAPVDDPEATIEQFIEGGADVEDLAETVEQQDPADAAITLERLEPEVTAEVIQEMEEESVSDALAHMDPALAATVMTDLDPHEAAELLGAMSPDDGADILQALPKALRAELLKLLPPKKSAVLGKLALYDPESAGGIMTTDIIAVSAGDTIGQAIEYIKRNPFAENQSEIYVTDTEKRLMGTISMRDLLLLDDRELVGAHVNTDIDSVLASTDREEVAQLFKKYGYVTVPVVDDQQRVLGIITHDDVLDIIAAEQTEDVFKQVGAGVREAVYSPVAVKARGRLPWLLLNLLTAQGASAVVLWYHDLVDLFPIAGAVYPVIANQAGNSGQQSLAVTLRGLVLGQVFKERVLPLLIREMLFGVLAGALVGLFFSAGIALLGTTGIVDDMNWRLGIVAGAAMTAALIVGCLVGSAVPLVMHKAGFDPATASSIILTCLTDSISYAIFLTLLILMHDWVDPDTSGILIPWGFNTPGPMPVP